ncbi:uncharacterized protein LOC126573357 [Anopheles aquasalis]|uniref:uncharacterized protein LOC126573357 n=1 Tax=Anopheles aquasalis TaxID=42839 RepID=UPI00215A2976|nr:uncharacterized protein LOC126573357 [Anopheles aquasalis]XP_050089371.1 uncharacterized protein LOC126573357 [Anopheles aquasalis]XP_050089372.1 uncharacterized protein LOC126573357 [Anopheles aquasalis]XP_050089373.1 uncharacterized protein LOC126573357 [Anopheles aquasalis]
MTDLSYRHGNGASTSSIYDYPEHLNPFYEDENHKRLRFWNHKPASNRSQRRGSFSSLRDGIREFWQYSSTHFRKKRSSTLGVNKTSESPPPLRREVYEDDSYATVGGGSGAHRNTVTGYETPARQTQSYSNTPLFVRHSRYRGSMQAPAKDNDEIGFTRNDRYRSTIQNGFSTYSTGMVTSTPRKKQAPALPYGTTPRVPQQHGNTNPFDEPMDQDGDTMSTYSLDDGDGSTLRSRRNGTKTRTKRRAPPPPPPISTQTTTSQQAIEESPANDEQTEDLRNLAAEIESFVRVSTTTGDDSPQVQPTDANGPVVQSCDVNNNAESTEIPTTVSAIEREIIVQEVRAADNVPKETIIAQPAAGDTVEKIVTANKTEDVPSQGSLKVTEAHTTTTVESIVTVENGNGESTPPLPASPIPVPRKKHDKSEPLAPREPPAAAAPSDIDFDQLALPETPVPTRRMSRERYMAQQVTTVEKPAPKLPIPKPPASSAEADEDDGPTTTIIVENVQYKLKVAPITTEINTKIESARMKISESTNNIATATTTATDHETAERRRSVRDIIESINKSQSMLKFNHDQSTNSLQSTQSTDSVTRNIRELNEREKEIQNLLQDINACYGAASDDTPNGDSAVVSPVPAAVPLSTGRGSYYDNLADDNLCANLDDRNQAVGGRVKKSPTKTLILSEGTDEQQYLDCMDWNPVPKPRRSNVP